MTDWTDARLVVVAGPSAGIVRPVVDPISDPYAYQNWLSGQIEPLPDPEEP